MRREVTYLTPMVQIVPRRGVSSFELWCRGCGSFGWALSDQEAEGFRKRHSKRCRDNAERAG